MRLLAATWPDRSPTADTLAAYWLALGHLDDVVFEQTIARCLRECTFWPAPAEILSRAQEILESAGLLPRPPADAWTEVERELRRSGAYGQPEWSNPLIGQVVQELGGTRHLALMELDRLAFVRREFVERYDAVRRMAITRDTALMSQSLPAPEPGRPALTDGEARARIDALMRQNQEALRALAGRTR
jgi:hypothetical protein